MPALGAEKESLHHGEIIAYLMLVSLYRKVRTIDTASEETIALLCERVAEVLERYGEKHAVKTSFINALPTLFMALLVSGMPLETTEVERVVRDVVMVFKRLHRQIQCEEGADIASIEMSLYGTCKKHGTSPADALLSILRNPKWTPFDGPPRRAVPLPTPTQ